MAMVPMLMFDAGQLIYTLATALTSKPDATKVNIIVGGSDTDDTLGGNAPYVALYDNYGKWMGYYEPDRKTVWDEGKTRPCLLYGSSLANIDTSVEGGNGGIDIKHSKWADTEPRASYILLSNVDNNAICISQIGIADLSVQTTFAGDMGKYCGMPWYPSNIEVGPTRKTPKCIWLDGDNTNGLPQALSFQIDAFAESQDKASQFMEYKDTLCKSTPRFAWWQDLDWNSPIPIFDPPLDYEQDFITGGQGGDKNFSQIVDTDLCKYDKEKERILRLDASCQQKGIKASTPAPTVRPNRKQRRDARRQSPEGTTKLSTRFASQLVVSSKRSHNATEVCDSETSFGPDFVSVDEGVFCSMSQKKTFPICGHDSDSTADVCFDLETQALVISESKGRERTLQIREALPATNYSLVRRW